jgi:hypothetical protein
VLRRALVLLAIVGLSVSAGCDGGTAPATTGAQGDTADTDTTATETTGTESTGPAEAGPVVYRLSGGIEGRDDLLSIAPDGTATVTPGFGGSELTEQLGVGEVAELYRLLDESGLFTEDQTFRGDIVDDFAFEIVYRGVTVAGDESASPAPLDAARVRLTELLESILARGANSALELPPLELTLELTGDVDGIVSQLPAVLTGHLYLEPAEDGLIQGVLSIVRDGSRPRLTAVSGRLQGNTATLEPSAASVAFDATLAWDSWELTFEDSDGDNVADSGAGRAAGTWTELSGDVIDQGTYEATLTASLDATEGHVFVGAPESREFLLPTDQIEIRFDEPVRAADVSTTLTVLADGEPLAGLVPTLDEVNGLIVFATFTPSGTFLPFDAEVTLDVGGLADPSGNAVVWDSGPMPTAADPGSLLDNPGFESGLAGWIPAGTVEAVEGFERLTPEEGEAFAVVREESSLAGYLDVPADAEALEFTVAVLSEANQFDPGYSVVVSLEHADGGYAVLDASTHAGESVTCEACTELGYRIGPLPQRVDLREWQGRRVFLTVEVRSSGYFGVNYFAAVLDDFRLV